MSDWHRTRLGALRGLLLRPSELPKIVNDFWNHLPHPRDRYAERIAEYCGFKSKGRAVLHDLFRLMMREHKAYRRNIPSYIYRMFQEKYPNTPKETLWQEDGFEMAMDNREQMAGYLAAARAEARLSIAPIPKTFKGYDEIDEAWMNLNSRTLRLNRKITVLELYKLNKRLKF
jgi:hypothetical protein